MGNKRDLKKYVRLMCGDIAAEALIAGTFVEGVDMKAMHEVVQKVANLQENTLAAISLSYDKLPSDFSSMREYHKARSSYYHKAFTSLKIKFLEKVKEIVAEMNSALPATVKEANKEACK